MLLIADITLTVLHTAVIVFNLLGWISPRTRRLHLLSCVLTLLSWAVLGIWYGWGYCFLTDWAWRIKEARGVTGLPDSFVKWLLDGITGLSWNALWVDIGTVGFGLAASGLSVYLNFRRSRP